MVAYLREVALKIFGKTLYAFLWFCGLIISIFPFFLKKAFAFAVAALWFFVIPFRKKIILHNIALVFPRKKEESNLDFRHRCFALARANMQHMVLLIIEIFERFHWSAKDLDKKFCVLGYENLKEHVENPNKGIFCLTAHLGNWELISWVGIFIGVRLSVVTRFLRNPLFDELWVKSRLAFGLELMGESGSGLSIIRAIRRGRAVGFIFDQHTGEPHGIPSRFLGLPAWSPKGLAIMNRKLKAPIIPCYVIRNSHGVTEVHLEPALDFCDESKFSDAEALAYHVQRCNDTIENWIRKYPEQYLWLHRRFKNIHDYRQSLPWDA